MGRLCQHRGYRARVRQLFPELAEIDPLTAHRSIVRHPPADRPWVMLNMVTSVDGATAVEGLSGGLGDPGDREVFLALRGVPDAILAGAATVRAEAYGPPRTPQAVQDLRAAAGQTRHPLLVVLTAGLDLDPALPLLTTAADDGSVPLIITGTDAPTEHHERLDGRAEIVVVDRPRPEVSDVLAVLHGRGVSTVLCEGGPALNGQLAAHDLIDEVDITHAPLLVGGISARILDTAHPVSLRMRLAHLWEQDGTLLARYVRTGR